MNKHEHDDVNKGININRNFMKCTYDFTYKYKDKYMVLYAYTHINIHVNMNLNLTVHMYIYIWNKEKERYGQRRSACVYTDYNRPNHCHSLHDFPASRSFQILTPVGAVAAGGWAIWR